jgi:hypothetical protein
MQLRLMSSHQSHTLLTSGNEYALQLMALNTVLSFTDQFGFVTK